MERTGMRNLDDIKLMVDAFYEKVKQDPVLGPIFSEKISDWGPHLETMYRFWNAALFNVREYTGNPFQKHKNLPLEQLHFERWIGLFYETIDERFEGEVSDEAKRKGMIMAHTFYSRMGINKELSPLPPVRAKQ